MSEAKGEQSSSSGKPSFIFLTKLSSFSTCSSFHFIKESGFCMLRLRWGGKNVIPILYVSLLTSPLTPVPPMMSPSSRVGFVVSMVTSTVSPGQA